MMMLSALFMARAAAMDFATYSSTSASDRFLRRLDAFEMFDEDDDKYITTTDLEEMMNYLHIWEETNQPEGDSISRSEIDTHVDEYYDLWERVVATIKALDVNNDNTTSLTDMRKVQHEMHLAEANYDQWVHELQNAASSVGQSFDTFSISHDELDAYALEQKTKFKNRMDKAYHRLGGTYSNDVTHTELREYAEQVALMMSFFHDLAIQKHFKPSGFDVDDAVVYKTTFRNKTSDVDAAAHAKYLEVQAERAAIKTNTTADNIALINFQNWNGRHENVDYDSIPDEEL